MKRGAKLAALLAALAVLVGAWLLAESMTRQRENALAERAHEPDQDISVGPAEEVTALAWNYFGDAVSLRYDGQAGAWINDQDPDCPIDQQAVEPLVQAVASLTAEGSVEGVTDFGQYGLEDPSFAVMAGTAEKVVTYYIGGTSAAGTWYVRMDGGDTVYLETGVLAGNFQIGLDDVLALETVPQDVASVTTLAVQTDAGDYTLAYRPGGEDWYTDTWPWFLLDEKGEVSRPLDTEQVEKLYGLATGLALTRCVTWSAGNGADYGLDEPQGTARVSYEDGDGGKHSFALQFGDYTADGDVYVRLAGSDMVYLAAGSVLDGLMYPDFEAMAPLAPTALDWDRLKSVYLELEEDSYAIQRSLSTPMSEGEEPEEIFTSGERSLDAELVKNWLTQVYELPADSRAEGVQGREMLYRFTFRQDSERFPEVTVEFWSYDSVHHLCVVNGEERYLVPRTSADSLAKTAATVITGKTQPSG